MFAPDLLLPMSSGGKRDLLLWAGLGAATGSWSSGRWINYRQEVGARTRPRVSTPGTGRKQAMAGENFQT